MSDDVANVRRRVLKNKPKESKWRQQTLPAYRPLMTARCMFPVILVQGLLFAGIGVLILVFDNAKEVVVDYTCCTPSSPVSNPDIGCKYNITPFVPYTCNISINLTEEYKGDVKFQYGLENYFQNNRLYIKSRNDVQLTGELKMTADCDDYASSNASGRELPIAPCGKVADSMFNDTFKLYYHNPTVSEGQDDSELVPFSTENVIWSVERKKKYKNPKYDASKNETLCDAFKDTAKPLNWKIPACQLGNDVDGYAFENIDFIAWMKPAALPKFRKNYRTLNKTGGFQNGLPQGNYTLSVTYNYPINQVTGYKGKKHFIIVQESAMGPKNKFLPIAFIAFGSFSVGVAFFFLIIQFKQRVTHYS